MEKLLTADNTLNLKEVLCRIAKAYVRSNKI